MSRYGAAMSSAIPHVMPPEFGGKQGVECLNTRLTLPTLLHAEYSVKLKKKPKIFLIDYNMNVPNIK